MIIKQGKTNWGFLLIVIVLAAIAGGGTFVYIKSNTKEIISLNQLPEIKPADETASWKTYRNEKYGFEVKYPKDFTIENINQGIKFIFPESYKNQSYKFKNDVTEAWIGVGIGLMNKEGFAGDFCQKVEESNYEEVKINNLNFIKGITGQAAMGGWYTEYNMYRTLHNGNCYEIILAVTGHGPGAGANNGMGPLPQDYASPDSKEKFISILDQLISTFKFLE